MLSNNILKFEAIIISLNGYKRYILSIILGCPDAPVKYYFSIFFISDNFSMPVKYQSRISDFFMMIDWSEMQNKNIISN